MRIEAAGMNSVRTGLDQPLLWVSVLLLLWGLVMVTSSSLQIADTHLDAPFHYGVRHAVYLLLGVAVACVVVTLVSIEWLRQLRFLALPLAVLLLTLVFIPGLGREVKGALRWIQVGGFTVQPSEIAKLCFVVYLAGYIAVHGDMLRDSWKGFLMPFSVLGLLALLLMMEPDFGAVVVFGVTTMGMLFLAGVPMRRFLLVGLVLAALVTVLAFAQPYRVARLLSFMDPWSDQFGAGYQLTQSLIAFGRGDWFGVGLGNSIQKLFYLPEAHTDFVYAVTAEEFGLTGNLFLLGLFVYFCYRIFVLGGRLEDQGMRFHAFLVYGVALLFSSQIMINLAVNMGLMPTKGLTLPFFSYGGTSLLVSILMVALVLRAAVELRARTDRRGGVS